MLKRKKKMIKNAELPSYKDIFIWDKIQDMGLNPGLEGVFSFRANKPLLNRLIFIVYSYISN